jgi:hypothetical protein
LSDVLLFQIPVYRVSRERSEQDVLKYVAAALKGLERAAGGRSIDREHHSAYAELTITRGLPWAYNQVMGWIEVEWNGPGPVIKATGFKVSVTRIQRHFTRDYRWMPGNLIECWFHDESSVEIAAAVREEIVALTKPGSTFAGRYVDLNAFDAVAPGLDWRRLLGLDVTT